MKNLGITLLVVMLMAGSAGAVVVFEEDFTGTGGADLTTKGWSKLGTGEILISDTEIDDGQSGHYGRRDAAGDILYMYDFPDVEADHYANEYFQLTMSSRAMDDLIYVRLFGKTRWGSNSVTYTQISHGETDVWGAPGTEEVGMYYTQPYINEYVDIAGNDNTVQLRLRCTPGLWQPPPMPVSGSRVLNYSETSDSGPWDYAYRAGPSTNGEGMHRVDFIQIIGGYAPTSGGAGGIYDSRETGFLDSIKLEKLTWLPGDVNGDGFVGGYDITQVISNWGMTTTASREDGDVTDDGNVGGADYTAILTAWGNGTPPPEPGTVPEPATIGLFLITGTILLAGRRR